ncbi:hypothetical protein [Streptomyces sp. NPDC059122]|uniref:hypothetical protein n=1 Tax=Streptomyces sp. NPDC059122 TaxID=3346732 RepID=UPI0036CE0666
MMIAPLDQPARSGDPVDCGVRQRRRGARQLLRVADFLPERGDARVAEECEDQKSR